MALSQCCSCNTLSISPGINTCFSYLLYQNTKGGTAVGLVSDCSAIILSCHVSTKFSCHSSNWNVNSVAIKEMALEYREILP